MAKISIYRHIKDVQSDYAVDLEFFLDAVKSGRWQDAVLRYRVELQAGKLSDDELDELKRRLPYATLSGEFGTPRSNATLKQHSGFIGVDVDKLELTVLNEVFDRLCEDKYVVAVFRSASARGLCIVFKINPAKHAESYFGLEEYLFKNYELLADKQCKEVSRARFATWDPELHYNVHAHKFAQYVKRPPQKKLPKYVHANDDFQRLVNEIEEKRVDIVDSYDDWFRVGFAIAGAYGEFGRDAFHRVSAISGKYSYGNCDKQYDNCLRSCPADKSPIGLSTFYYKCLNAGLSLYSERTKSVMIAAIGAKQSGRNVQSAIETVVKFSDISAEDAKPIIEQVFENNITTIPDEVLVSQLAEWMRFETAIVRNEISGMYENAGLVMDDRAFNGLYLRIKKIFDKSNYELMERIIRSDNTPDRNPLHDFFDAHAEIDYGTGHIEKLFSSIDTPEREAAQYFGKKWLVGLIACAYYDPSPLLLLLAGPKQGTGKTQFFRRMFPAELKAYYAESKLEEGKDADILLCRKWLIVDDEFSGKSKKDEARLKEMLSYETIDVREPYGRNSVTMRRLAGLGGTSNTMEVLSDPTGNRRVICIRVDGIDHKMYNSIDKVALLMEAWHIYKTGRDMDGEPFDWRLTQEDIALLAEATKEDFNKYAEEYELLIKFTRKPKDGEHGTAMTATEIKLYLEQQAPGCRLTLDRIGKELRRLGYVQRGQRVNGVFGKYYQVIRVGTGPFGVTQG